jgi:hypothetical protein
MVSFHQISVFFPLCLFLLHCLWSPLSLLLGFLFES